MRGSISRIQKNKRDAERRTEQNDPDKQTIYHGTPAGGKRFINPSQFLTPADAVTELNTLKGAVTIAGSGGILVSVDGQTITIDGSG